MSDDVQYHENRAAQELALASSSATSEARERHMELAERHSSQARALRANRAGNAARSVEDSTSTAINLSRELIQNSHRILADSRKNV
ncbi:hypothetical protein FHT02_003780 [Sphingomonas xinjiangensis]|uniref:Uncharacterized protein n=1 Tax=Sphingomonas xinjiangensis TaxID=643568 RepID=A0A840YS75_9SPHN|nr:hypothetical protein [Sphingomonas xinjiangensis]